MQRHRADLARAGFKVMVGGPQFNRKSAYPIEILEGLLDEVRRGLETDAGRSRGPG